MLAGYAFKARKFFVHTILHAADTPHRVALGVGIAMLVAFLPLVGIQTIVAIALAAVFRANKAVCIPIVWITNPVTMGPIYLACLKIGQVVTSSEETVGAKELLAKLGPHDSLLSLFHLSFWKELLTTCVSLGIDLWVGCFIVGVGLGLPAYFLARWAVAAFRRRHKHRIARRKRRQLFRAKLKKAALGHRREPAG